MIYCFARQLRSVMEAYPTNQQIRPIISPSDIKGIETETFVHVSPARVLDQVPEVLFRTMYDQGFIIIHINLQHHRDFLAEKK